MQGKIAIEEHFVTAGLEHTLFPTIGWDPDEWADVQRRLGEAGSLRLEEMDRHGVEIAVLSLAAPCIQLIADPYEAVVQARASNDALAGVVESHPDRFAGFAALPMQDPKAAANELARSVEELGFRGALVNGYSNLGDGIAYYDEPQFLPVWERLAELGVPLYLHPRNPWESQMRIYEDRGELLGPAWAFAVETATHALRLITSGLFDRFPDLTVILGHLGEMLPFAVDRLQQRLSHVPAFSLQRSAPAYLRENFYVTTSGNFHTQSLIGALLQVGADRIMFAVDYPFESHADAAAWFDTVAISEPDRLKIGRTNAQRLLGLSPTETTGDMRARAAAPGSMR
ncbi:MAG: amidohydrolase [Solirubrobacterales bacterium]|nr:amidohydrolase [Solirubrobacterales bacterium]